MSPSSVCSSPCASTGVGRGDGLFRAPRSNVLSLSSALESGRLTTSQICRCRLTHRAARSSSPAASSTPKAWQKAPNPKPSAEAEEPSLCPTVSAHSSRKRVELVGSPSSRRSRRRPGATPRSGTSTSATRPPGAGRPGTDPTSTGALGQNARARGSSPSWSNSSY